MPRIQKSWLEELADKSFIEPFETDTQTYYRLSTPFQFVLSGEKARELIREYDAGYEKGGLLLSSIKRIGNKTFLTIEKVVIVPNISEFPSDSYCPEENLMEQVVDQAFKQRLLPLIFHTHPTKSFNILDEIKLYHQQMETSWMDRRAALYSHSFKNVTLRLPEILIIGNGSLKQGLFVGVYGGLIAPVSFRNRKAKILLDFGLQQVSDLIESIDTPEKTLIAAGTALLLAKLAADNPIKTRSLIQKAYEILPGLVYGSAKENCFFGLTYASKLKITLPRLPDLFIREEEATVKKRIGFRGKKFVP